MAYSRSPKGRVQALYQGAKGRAKQKDLPFELDREWIAERLEYGHCEVSGLPFNLNSPTDSSIDAYTPSIDKIVPALGYTKANSRLVIFAVNAAKQDWSDDTLLAVADAIHSNKSNITGKYMQQVSNRVIVADKPIFTAIDKLVRVLGSAGLDDIASVSNHSHDYILDVLGLNQDFVTIRDGRVVKIYASEKDHFVYKWRKDIPKYDDANVRVGQLEAATWPHVDLAIEAAKVLNLNVNEAMKSYSGQTTNFEPLAFIYLPDKPEQELNDLGFFRTPEEVLAFHWQE